MCLLGLVGELYLVSKSIWVSGFDLHWMCSCWFIFVVLVVLHVSLYWIILALSFADFSVCF